MGSLHTVDNDEQIITIEDYLHLNNNLLANKQIINLKNTLPEELPLS